jgi:hypothetical protein
MSGRVQMVFGVRVTAKSMSKQNTSRVEYTWSWTALSM